MHGDHTNCPNEENQFPGRLCAEMMSASESWDGIPEREGNRHRDTRKAENRPALPQSPRLCCAWALGGAVRLLTQASAWPGPRASGKEGGGLS